jgi:hypothetical protein
MAVTKILARKGGLKNAIAYVMNGDKTEEQLLVATHLCTQASAYEDMTATKQRHGKTDGVQCYHLIQSFQPGEITPELALAVAQEFVQAHLSDYETVIGVHVDKHHIHAHILFNSVNWRTGEKYHSNARTYYTQIRAISDRLCREHGLSVIAEPHGKSMSYMEWLRQSKGQPTYRSMLEADLKIAMEDANDIGHFYMLMEHMGYEIKHRNRLGFRLQGQAHFMFPERQNPKYSEDGIRNYIDGNLQAIEAGLKPVITYRTPYQPYKKHPKYTGFLALYVHYLYILGKIQKQQYPPRMTPKLRKEVMRFAQLRAQFQFMQEHGIETEPQMRTFQAETEEKLKALTKQRTILNVQKKKQQPLFKALADEAALAPVRALHEEGIPGLEPEYQRYVAAVEALNASPVPRDELTVQKAALYTKLADLNREIRQKRKELQMCQEILAEAPGMEQEIQRMEGRKREQARQR